MGSISPITDEGGGAAGDDDLRSRVSWLADADFGSGPDGFGLRERF